MRNLLTKFLIFIGLINKKDHTHIAGSMLLHRYKDGIRTEIEIQFKTSDPDFAKNWPCSDATFPVVYIKKINIL